MFSSETNDLCLTLCRGTKPDLVLFRGNLKDLLQAPPTKVAAVVKKPTKPTLIPATKIPHAEGALGELFRSTPFVELTEPLTEYRVKCIKHMTVTGYIVFEFRCWNTFTGNLLQNVGVSMQNLGTTHLTLVGTTPILSLPADDYASAYVTFSYGKGTFPIETFHTVLQFSTRGIDQKPEDSYEDEYTMEDIGLDLSDYMKPQPPMYGDWSRAWNDLKEKDITIREFILPRVDTCASAIHAILSVLSSMRPHADSDKVESKKTRHTLMLSGRWISQITVLARVRIMVNSGGAKVQLSVGSSETAINKMLVQAFID